MLAKTDALRQKHLILWTNQVSSEMSQLSLNFLLPLALLLAASTAEAIIRPLPPYLGAPTQDGLTRLFLNSRLTRNNPRISMSCFAGYIGESSLIAELYSEAYNGCLEEAYNSRRGIDKDFLPIRREIESSAESVCNALRVCGKTNDTLDSFNCHAAIVSIHLFVYYWDLIFPKFALQILQNLPYSINNSFLLLIFWTLIK